MLACKIIKQPDLDVYLNDSFKFIAVELVIKNGKNIIIGLVYCPSSGDLDLFNEEVECLLSFISRNKEYCILEGDYNINLLNHEIHVESDQFLNNVYSWSYFPIITQPTRFTETSVTFNNIFTNIPNESAFTGILIAVIFYQLLVFYISAGFLYI